MAAVIETLVLKLSSNCDAEETLRQLKTAVYTMQLKDLKDIVQTLPLHHIFSKLYVNRSEEIKLSKAILIRLFECLPADIIYSQFRDDILSGLSHGDEDITILCLTEIKRYVAIDGAVSNLICDVNLLQGVVQCLGDDSLLVATVASHILCSVGKYDSGLEVMFSSPLLEEFMANMSKNDIIRYRVYDVAVTIAVSYPDALLNSNLSDILQMLMFDINKDDILVQINSIEMLSTLAASSKGFDYLKEHAIVSKIEEMIQSSESNPLVNFLMPALIKFFGSLACHDPKEICEKHRTFLKTTFDLLSTSDAVLLGVVIDTIGIIGSSVEGRLALNKQGTYMIDAMKQIGCIIQRPPTEVKQRGLICLTNLMSIKVEEQTDDVLSMIEQWFFLVHERPLDVIMSICQQPFKELRCPALGIINGIANQNWGQMLLNSQPGFKEYLLNRFTESEKCGKEAKFKIVETLVETTTTSAIFGAPYYLKLKTYVHEGPFYVRAQTEVALQRE